MKAGACDTPFLLGPRDRAAVELVRPKGTAGLVLTCEHAGHAVPEALAWGMPDPDAMNRHIAWDIGAEAVARGLSARLDAALAIQPYSRLVIDCNRPRHAADLAPAVCDGVTIQFNRALSEAALDARWQAIHQPFHRAVSDLIAQRAKKNVALLAVHSFTRRLGQGPLRPWHIGLLARTDLSLVDALAEQLARRVPDLNIGVNEPYKIENDSDYTIPVHGEARALPHSLIEIRNDLIVEADGAARWADLLASSLADVLPRILSLSKV